MSLRIKARGLKQDFRFTTLCNIIERYNHSFETEDVFLVSYPKSGNTWTRFMLTGLYLWEFNNGQSEPNYFNIHTYVKDLHIEIIKPRNYFSGLPRIIKSHRPYSPNYTRVIFVVRDVRDTMISRFKFINRNKILFSDFDEFLRNKSFGVKSWVRHSQCWLGSSTMQNKKVLLLRYEDLLDRPHEGVKQILDFLNVKFNSEAIEWVVQMGSKERVKELESTFGRARTSKEPFLRKGEKSQWKSGLSAEQLEYIQSVARPMMEKLGYEW